MTLDPAEPTMPELETLQSSRYGYGSIIDYNMTL